MQNFLPEATAEQPDDVSGPAGSEEAAVASFVREFAASDPSAEPNPPTDEQDEDADESPVDEPAEEEEAADDADESEDESDEAPVRTFTVKVDGKRVEVPEQELINGYQRFADYTRKTTELSNERKSLESEMGQVKRVREEYEQRLTQLAQALKETAGEPDWERLKADDPIGFATQFAEWQIKQQQMTAVEREQQRLQQESDQQRQAELQSYLQSEQQKLLTALPEWKEPAKAKADHDKIMAYARERGFRDEELAQVNDHRLVLLLRDAAKYQELAAKVKATPTPSSKTAKPSPTLGATGQRKPVSDLTKAKQRLAKTGNAEDAIPMFLAAMKRK